MWTNGWQKPGHLGALNQSPLGYTQSFDSLDVSNEKPHQLSLPAVWRGLVWHWLRCVRGARCRRREKSQKLVGFLMKAETLLSSTKSEGEWIAVWCMLRCQGVAWRQDEASKHTVSKIQCSAVLKPKTVHFICTIYPNFTINYHAIAFCNSEGKQATSP